MIDAEAHRPPRPWRRLAPPLLLTLLCALTFSNALPREFIFDAKPIIAEHPLLKPESPWWRLFTSTYWGDLANGGLYRPVTLLTFRVEQQVFGFGRAWQHAVVNLALHASVVLLLWRLAVKWTRSAAAALVAASLYAVHPVATEVVPNLVGRADLLAAIGVLAGLLAWERVMSAEAGAARGAWAIAAVLLWALGLLSKESAIVLPAIALVAAAWRRRRDGLPVASMPVIRSIALPVVLLSAAAATYLCLYAWITSHGPPTLIPIVDNPTAYEPAWVRVLTAVKILAVALRVCVLPIWLSADYSFDVLGMVTSPADPMYLLGLLLLLALVTAAVCAWRARSAAAPGLALFACAYLPTSNFLFPIGTIFAERLLYLPLAGLCLAAGVLAAWFWSRAATRAARPDVARRAAVVALSVIIGLLAARTHARNRVWLEWDGFFARGAEIAPRSLRMHTVMATLYAARPDTPEALDAAIRHADAAYRLAQGLPPWARSREALNLGATLLDRGVYDKRRGHADQGTEAIARSIPLFQEALRLRDAEGPLPAFVARAKRWRAERGLPEPQETNREYAIHANLGKAFFELGAWAEAAAALGAASALEPGDRSVHTLWGRALANSGDLDRAAEVLHAVARAKPTDPAGWRDIVRVHLARRDPAAASRVLDDAESRGLDPATVAELRRSLIAE